MRALAVLGLLLCSLLLPSRALAAFGGTTSFVEQGPVHLDASGKGRFTVRNTGAEPLHVNTLYARTNERDPRIPGTLKATFEGGGTKVDLAPNESRAVLLEWDRRGAKLGQLVGHVVVESSDPAAPQRAMGVTASGPTSFGWLRDHVATWLVLLPLLGALVILPLRASRKVDEKNARWIALVTVGLTSALVLFAVRAFDGSVTRLDGNEGLQLVERARLFAGMEWYLAVDGVSLPLLCAFAVTAVAAVLASFRIRQHHEAFFAGMLVVIACTHGALLSMDAMLLATFFAGAFAAVCTLAFRFGRPGLAVRTAVFGAVSVGLLLTAVLALRRQADPAFLVDGVRAQTFSIPELARIDWLDRAGNALFFGKPFVKGVFVAVFVAAAIPLAVAPFHGMLGGLFLELPAGASIVASSATSLLGAHLLTRFGLTVVPNGLRWAAPGLSLLGAVTVIFAALVTLGAKDLRRAIAGISAAHGGVVLLGLAACTPQGLSGAVAMASTRAVTIAALLVIAGALDDRVRTGSIQRFGGLRVDAPRLAALSTFAFLGAALVPGTASFAASFVTLGGSFPLHRGATALAALGLVLLAAGAALLHRRVFLGALDESWRRSPELEPFGGRFPDADRREAVLLGGLAIVIVALGLMPRLLFSISSGTIDDLDARVNPERIAVVEPRGPFRA